MSLSDSSEASQGYMDQLRLPMLSIPFKQGNTVDLTSPLAELIRNEFGEDPTQFRQEVREFNQLRELAIRPSRDNAGTSVVRRYYAQLCLLPTRFAATRSDMQVTFIWSDSFIEKEFANNMLQCETSAILFNLGALHSRLGSDLPDELRSACTHFQCAAGAFYLLQTSLSSNIHVAIAPTQVDMSSEVVAFCKNLLLGQAQECMVEKSITEKKRPSLVAKVAWEVSTLYQKAIDLLDTQMGQQVAKKNKNWQKFLQTKFHIYQSVANYCQALSLEEESNYGHSIGYLQIATDNILAASKVVKALQPALKNAVKYLTELIQAKAQATVQTNQQVYHQLVPQLSELEEIHGAILVKPIEFSISDKSVLGADIFSKLVPMSILEGSSLYSEVKANLLRSVCESIQEKDKELGEFLSKMNIEEVLNYKDTKIHIPQDVSGIRAEVLSEEGRVEGMDALLQSVLQMSNQIHRKLDEISMYLTRDSTELANQITEFQAQADKIDEYLLQGDKSNQELHQVMKELKPKLTLLASNESTFLSSLPKLDLLSVAFDETAESKLHLLMAKIQEMQNQRASLERQLRGELECDDISSQLIASELSREELFESGMKRHRESAAVIRQNCTAQDNILKAMTDTNASLAGVRKELNTVKGTRDTVYRGLVEAWRRMGSTEESLKEGMKFYQNLYKKTLKLFESIKSVFPTSPLQQPIKPSDASTTDSQDSAYKPIVPFMSPPGDSNRPPVPSRRLKPTNEIEEQRAGITEEQKFDTEKQKAFDIEKQKAFATEKQKAIDTEKQKFDTEKQKAFDTEKQKFDTEKQKVFETENQKFDAIEDDTELALINWAANKQENNEINITQSISPIKEHVQDIRFPPDQSNPVPKLSPVPFLPPVQLANQITAAEHIPKVPTLATPALDTSQLAQLIQTNQSELSFALSSLQGTISATGQSVAELALSMSAVVNHSSQSNAAISNLNQTTANQSASIEQLSSHLQTTNQNVVYTSQLVKLIETSLLAKLDSVENSNRDTANRLSQLIELMTQHKQDTAIRIDSILDRISSNQSTHSLEQSTLNTALGEIREELRFIRNKQESIILAPGQSESMVPRDPLSFENRPMEAPSEVEQLWDLLGKKPDIVSSACDTFVPSELTAFSPIRNRPSSAFQLASGQSAVSLGMSSSIPSANQVASLSQIASNQSVSSLDPLSSLHTQALPQMQYPQPSMVHPHPHFAPTLSQVSTPLPQLQQMGPSPLLQTQHFQQTQYNPHTQQHTQAVQPNVHIPVIPAVQSIPHIPVNPAGQSNVHIPVNPAGQSNVHIPVNPAVQSNVHIPVMSAGQSNVALNPQQHAYLQQLQKQLITSSPQSLSPDQLIAFQKQMLYLSQLPPQ